MPSPIELRSDNAAGIAPEILSALATANEGSALAYGGDPWSGRLRDLVAEVFEHPDVAVFPVASGTAANALALSALCPPWGSVLCHETAHILRSECGATSMFGGGAVMRGLPGDGYVMHPESLRDAFAATNWGDPHHSQPSVLSFTCPTDYGTLYTPDDVRVLAEIAREHQLRVHLDGARIANAIDALGCTPADLTWRAGVDVFSLGAIKNGAATTDAVVSFDPAVSEELMYRVKRAGHVASKMRFQAAQLIAYLTDGLWLQLAHQANAAMTELARGLRTRGLELLVDPQVNIAFVRVPEETEARLAGRDLLFYGMGDGIVRFVTSWQTTPDDVTEVLHRVDEALSPR